MGEINKIKDEPKHGRKQNQKLKPYVVLQYLMKETAKISSIVWILRFFSLIFDAISVLMPFIIFSE